MSQQGRVLGIGGIFFKSANRQQAQEWYAKHLGLADSGHGVMLPWREKDENEAAGAADATRVCTRAFLVFGILR